MDAIVTTSVNDCFEPFVCSYQRYNILLERLKHLINHHVRRLSTTEVVGIGKEIPFQSESCSLPRLNVLEERFGKLTMFDFVQKGSRGADVIGLQALLPFVQPCTLLER